MAQTRDMLWPVIADEKSATTAVQRASKWVFAWSFLLIAIGLLDLLIISFTSSRSQQPSGASVAIAFVWYTIGEGIVFAVIGWRIRMMSVAWSVTGLLVCVVGVLATLKLRFALLVYAFLVLIFANAVRATTKYKHVAARTP